jgi:hypothetical protein
MKHYKHFFLFSFAACLYAADKVVSFVATFCAKQVKAEKKVNRLIMLLSFYYF